MDEVAQENEERVVITRTKNHLTREERVAFGFIGTCSAFAFLLGGFFFLSNIKKPFLVTYHGPRYMTSSEKESEEEMLQRITDTDEDGVSDYDELHIFLSSPYIADTDSDGRSDGVEIAEGGDPNCALGKTCSSNSLQQEGSAVENVGDDSFVVNEVPATTPLETLNSLSQLSPTDVRALLRESGVESASLDALTDEQIMIMYNEVLNQVATEVDQQ